MQRLRNIRMDPPGRWWFICEDGFRVDGGHYEKLVRNVRKHLEINEMDVPDNLEAIIQDQICQRVPESICIGEGPNPLFPSDKKILAGTRKIIKATKKLGRPKILEDTQLARMYVCISCKMNMNRMGCFKCQLPYKLSAGAFGDLGHVDDHLAACDYFEATGLALTSAPDAVLESVFDSKDGSGAPVNCWLKQLTEATRGEKKHAKPKRRQRSKSTNRKRSS